MSGGCSICRIQPRPSQPPPIARLRSMPSLTPPRPPRPPMRTHAKVWQAFPSIQITGTAKCGFLVRLSMRFLILVYQSLYFM